MYIVTCNRVEYCGTGKRAHIEKGNHISCQRHPMIYKIENVLNNIVCSAIN